MFGCPSPSSGKGSELQQHSISCRSGRGEALLSFRRAPRGLALRRYRVGCHRAIMIAQSYPGDFGSPAFAADDSNEDALAVHSARIRKDTWPCTTVCAGDFRPPAHSAAHSHAQGTRATSTAHTRRRPRVVARLAQGQARTPPRPELHTAWSTPSNPSRLQEPAP